MAEKQSPGWKKYFKVADTTGQLGPISGRYADGFPGYGKNNGTDNYPADMVYRN